MLSLQHMRVVYMPPFRAVSSGSATFDELFGEGGFDSWCGVHPQLMRDLLHEPADFLWHEGPKETWGRGQNVMIRAICETVTAEDVAPYALYDFPGGYFLVGTANENDPEDMNETIGAMFRWIEESDVFQYGDFPASGMCNMPGGPVNELLGIAQQQIFLPLKKR